MRILLIPLMVLFQFHLAGCAGNRTTMPMSAEAFRQAVPGTATMERETFEVNRQFDSVVSTFKRKATECLDKTVTTSSRAGGSYQVIVSNWNPTFTATRDQAELHIQRVYEKGVLQVYDEPEKGHFVMVVDIAPASLRKTKIDIYRPSRGLEVILKAVKSWATGKDIVCPDMTKT